jgi:hypothetical protein
MTMASLTGEAEVVFFEITPSSPPPPSHHNHYQLWSINLLANRYWELL